MSISRGDDNKVRGVGLAPYGPPQDVRDSATNEDFLGREQGLHSGIYTLSLCYNSTFAEVQIALLLCDSSVAFTPETEIVY